MAAIMSGELADVASTWRTDSKRTPHSFTRSGRCRHLDMDNDVITPDVFQLINWCYWMQVGCMGRGCERGWLSQPLAWGDVFSLLQC
jgi:hypothetical protein